MTTLTPSFQPVSFGAPNSVEWNEQIFKLLPISDKDRIEIINEHHERSELLLGSTRVEVIEEKKYLDDDKDGKENEK